MSLVRKPHVTRAAIERILRDRSRSPGERFAAVSDAGRINAEWRQGVLIESCGDPDDWVCAAAVSALGRTGGAEALPAVLKVADTRKGVASARARFAAILISHRLGLPGEELGAPATVSVGLRDRRSTTETLKVSMVAPREAITCIESLVRQPLDIQLSAHYFAKAQCAARTLMIGFNSEIIEGKIGLSDLAKRKCVLGAVAQKHPNVDFYYYHMVVLNSPSSISERPNVFAFRLTGDLVLTGTAQYRSEEVSFRLESPNGSGPFGLTAQGVATRTSLSLAPPVVTIVSPFFRKPLSRVTSSQLQ